MFETVYPHIWMALPIEIRAQLVKDFDIKRTGRTEIIDQTIVSDGYSLEDLKAISLEKMAAYIGSQETFPRAWEITCSKAKGEVNPPINISSVGQAIEPTPQQFEKAIEVLKDAEIIPETNAKTKKS